MHVYLHVGIVPVTTMIIINIQFTHNKSKKQQILKAKPHLVSSLYINRRPNTAEMKIL